MASLTETQMKLRDAGIQMRLALANTNNEDVFRSCINSFIAAGRSIVDVMKDESQGNSKLLGWCESEIDRVNRMGIVQFFETQRDTSIHRETIKPKSYSTPVSVVFDGKEMPEKVTMRVWIFENVDKFLPGDTGNVLRLCEQYFMILKSLVHSWLREKETLEAH
jgi:hypothetical protein